MEPIATSGALRPSAPLLIEVFFAQARYLESLEEVQAVRPGYAQTLFERLIECPVSDALIPDWWERYNGAPPEAPPAQ